jgi:acetyl-CoA C-acetyltransferase
MIGAGDADILLVGGMESYSTMCAEFSMNDEPYKLVPPIPLMPHMAPTKEEDISMIEVSDKMAAKWNISREEADAFAARSQMRLAEAYKKGITGDEIIPFIYPATKRTPEIIIDKDEFPRPSTTLEGLAKLRSVIPGGVTTAGNSSGRNDGASALLVMSREKADELGYDYYLRHVSSAVVGLEPKIMGVGPIEASREALEKAGLKIEDIGLIELNEAFAAQSVAVMREWAKWSDKETFDTIWERTNVNGSGISLGHPLAATGGILTTKLFYELKERPDVRYAMVTMCIGGGMGFASIFEQCRKDG